LSYLGRTVSCNGRVGLVIGEVEVADKSYYSHCLKVLSSDDSSTYVLCVPSEEGLERHQEILAGFEFLDEKS